MGTIRDIGFKLVKKFLTEEEQKLASDYCVLKHRNNFNTFDESNSNYDTFFYGDPFMESLLLNKKPLMEEHTGLKLLPTYAFWRIYTLHSELPIHTDRPACEVSVTVKIGSKSLDLKQSEDWPFYVNGKKVDLEDGDALIYLGDLEHGRDQFQGDWNAQAFLHYVDANGDRKDEIYDRRPLLGHPAVNNIRR